MITTKNEIHQIVTLLPSPLPTMVTALCYEAAHYYTVHGGIVNTPYTVVYIVNTGGPTLLYSMTPSASCFVCTKHT